MDLTDLLLDHGADVNLDDSFLGSPLYAAVLVRNSSLVSRLPELGSLPNEDISTYGTCPDVLHIAATYEDTTILKELLKHGANPNVHCQACPSALTAAVKMQRLDTIDILVKYGAKIREPNGLAALLCLVPRKAV